MTWKRGKNYCFIFILLKHYSTYSSGDSAVDFYPWLKLYFPFSEGYAQVRCFFNPFKSSVLYPNSTLYQKNYSLVYTTAYLPTSGDLKSGDSLFCTTPPPPPTPECQQHQHPHSPTPAPTNCLRTFCDILHDVHGIKMRFHHCNDELIFVID